MCNVKHTPVLVSHAAFMGVFTHKLYKHFREEELERCLWTGGVCRSRGRNGSHLRPHFISQVYNKHWCEIPVLCILTACAFIYRKMIYWWTSWVNFFASTEQTRQIESYSVLQISKMHKMSVSLSCVNSPLALIQCLCQKFPNVELTPCVYV